MSDKIVPVMGTGPDDGPTGWYFHGGEQWSSLFGGCNWYDFTLIKVQGEFAPYTGRWELECWLLGVGFTLTYVYDDTFHAEIRALASASRPPMPANPSAPRDSVETRRDAYFRVRRVDGVSAAYDYLATQFERDTGKMAPGKDVSAEEGGGDRQANFEEFHQWRKAHGCYPPIPTPTRDPNE